ncbi:hypothetical protein P3T43_003873 [Paraburkholderia sp. GAS41]|jgi:hypothetical protein
MRGTESDLLQPPFILPQSYDNRSPSRVALKLLSLVLYIINSPHVLGEQAETALRGTLPP